MKIIKEEITSSIPVNNAGGGKIDGIGVGAKGEPGGRKKKKSLWTILKRKSPNGS